MTTPNEPPQRPSGAPGPYQPQPPYQPAQPPYKAQGSYQPQPPYQSSQPPYAAQGPHQPQHPPYGTPGQPSPPPYGMPGQPQPPYAPQGSYQTPTSVNPAAVAPKKKRSPLAIAGIVAGAFLALCLVSTVIAAVSSPSARKSFNQGYAQGQKEVNSAGGATTPAAVPTTAAPATTQPAPTKTTAAPAPTTPAATHATTKAAAPPPAPPVVHQPTTVLSLQGNGIKKTAIFTTGAEWQLSYTYDCKSFGSAGNFQVYEFDGGGGLSDSLANELSMSGSDTVPQHADPGQHYLEINSECSWAISVKS